LTGWLFKVYGEPWRVYFHGPNGLEVVAYEADARPTPEQAMAALRKTAASL